MLNTARSNPLPSSMRIVIADSEASERATLVALCRSRGVSAELHTVESGSAGYRTARPPVG
jgi:hypothetical protein